MSDPTPAYAPLVYVLTETPVNWDGWATSSPTIVRITASKADADEFVQEQRMHLRRNAAPHRVEGTTYGLLFDWLSAFPVKVSNVKPEFEDGWDD